MAERVGFEPTVPLGTQAGVAPQSKPSSVLCSVQARGRLIRFVKFSVVRSTGWVPERILATISGARNASGIRWIQSLPYCGLQIGLHARAQAAAYGEWANDLRPPTFRAECGKPHARICQGESGWLRETRPSSRCPSRFPRADEKLASKLASANRQARTSNDPTH